VADNILLAGEQSTMTHPLRARYRNKASYAVNALIVMLGVVLVAGTLLGVRQLREQPGKVQLLTASKSEVERD
jgi:hypothetical protein